MENRISIQELPPLPFTYERTPDPTKAVDEEWRISPVSIKGLENKPRTDNEILNMIKERREQKDWRDVASSSLSASTRTMCYRLCKTKPQ